MPSPFSSVLKRTLLVSCLFLVSCQAVVRESGSIIDPERANQIQIGKTTHTQVRELLGPPTLFNTFRPDRWIYIQDRQFKNYQRTFSRVANRIEITFDEGGVVKNIQRNFDDSLMDPTKMPTGQYNPGYVDWIWDGNFSKPATNTPNTEEKPMAEKEPPTSSPVQSETKEQTPATSSWWRFWSR